MCIYTAVCWRLDYRSRKYSLTLWVTSYKWQIYCRISVAFLSLYCKCFPSCMCRCFMKDEGAGGHTEQIKNSIVYFFLFLPSLCLCLLACATLSCLIIPAKCISRSWFRSASWEGSVPVKTTRARMTVQMHDSVMSQKPEAKPSFKQMHMSEHMHNHMIHSTVFICA